MPCGVGLFEPCSMLIGLWTTVQNHVNLAAVRVGGIGGIGMDEIALATAAASALVGAMATDAWQQARDGLVGLWRRIRPERAERISNQLETLHTQVLDARAEEAPAEMLQGLEITWRAQLGALLQRDPQAAAQLRRILDEQLLPALEPGDRERVYKVIQTVYGGTGHNVAGHTININDNRGTTGAAGPKG